MALGSFRPAPAKIQQILEAGKKQLSPEEFEELEALLGVEEPWFLVGIISLGVASGQLRERPPRKPPEEVCTFVG